MTEPSEEELDRLVKESETEESRQAEREKGHVLDQIQARIKDPKNNPKNR